MSSCSILVSSCDKFNSAWNPFFILLKKYWPNCPYKLYLNTESLKYNNPDVVTLNSLCDSWSGRLIESLKKIDSDYIIFVLEDFFLMRPVQDHIISKIIKILEQDPTIAVVYPKKITGFDMKDDVHPEWIRMDYNKDVRYLVNCQFAVWNKIALLELLRPGLSPWDLERLFKVPDDCKYKFYCLPYGNRFSIDGDVFPYYFAIQNGYGIAKSKWLWNNKKLFKKEKIAVDYSSLGTLSYFQYNIDKLKFKLKRILDKSNAKPK